VLTSRIKRFLLGTENERRLIVGLDDYKGCRDAVAVDDNKPAVGRGLV
jgi:hypothetical protein